MKKSLKILFMLSFFMLFITTSCSSDDNNNDDDDNDDDNDPVVKEIHFNDARLAVQVRLALGLSENDAVTEENILNLTELEIDGEGDITPNGNIREISDLSGLEYAENLTYLHFGATKVTDLTPIGGLKKMDYLRMNDTDVTDLSPLSGYTTLTYFNANTARGITDLSPLAGNA